MSMGAEERGCGGVTAGAEGSCGKTLPHPVSHLPSCPAPFPAPRRATPPVCSLHTRWSLRPERSCHILAWPSPSSHLTVSSISTRRLPLPAPSLMQHPHSLPYFFFLKTTFNDLYTLIFQVAIKRNWLHCHQSQGYDEISEVPGTKN